MNTNKTRLKAVTATPEKKGICAAERRYRTALFKIRAVGRSRIAKEMQVDIAHHINQIDTYGFGFFPNHYVFNDIVALETIATSLSYQ